MTVSKLIYRGELTTALRAAEEAGCPMPPDFAARLFGFAGIAEEPPQPQPFTIIQGEGAVPQAQPTKDAETEAASVETDPSTDPQPSSVPTWRFWCIQRAEQRPEEPGESRLEMPAELRDAQPLAESAFAYNGKPLTGRPLLPWSRLWPFLKQALGRQSPSRSPDVPRLVRQLARGEVLQHIPQRKRSAWHPEVEILLDPRPGLACFHDDIQFLQKRLARQRSRTGLTITRLELDDDNAFYTWKNGQPQPWHGPKPGSRVLALTDLAQYQSTACQLPWQRLGQRLQRQGIAPWALSPCPRPLWSPRMARTWNMACWDRGQRLPTTPC